MGAKSRSASLPRRLRLATILERALRSSPRDFIRERPPQEIGDVKHLHARASMLKTGAKLQDAAGIGGDDDLRAGFQDVFDLAPLQPPGHLRFGQIVTARAAATDIRLGHFDKICSRDGFDQEAWLLGDPLRMRQVTGIMISHFERVVLSAEC